MNSMTGRFRSWFAYEKDCNSKVLQMLESVSLENRNHASFQKAIDKFAHAIVCRELWMYRFGYTESPPSSVFPDGVKLDQLPAMLDRIYNDWDRFFGELNDQRVGEVFKYRSNEGDTFSNTLEDILIQLNGHMMYHRGQVATLVSQCHGNVVDTDFVFWTRILIPEIATQGAAKTDEA